MTNLANPAQRARITTNAFHALRQYFRGQRFIEHVRAIAMPAPLASAPERMLASMPWCSLSHCAHALAAKLASENAERMYYRPVWLRRTPIRSLDRFRFAPGECS